MFSDVRCDLQFLPYQVLIDQSVFAPIGLSSFYIGLTTLEFKSPQEVYDEWREKFPKTWQVKANLH